METPNDTWIIIWYDTISPESHNMIPTPFPGYQESHPNGVSNTIIIPLGNDNIYNIPDIYITRKSLYQLLSYNPGL